MKSCACYRGFWAIGGFLLTMALAPAAPIPGLFNTGVNTNGALLSGGVIDPHYKLVQSSDGSAPGPNVFVVNDGYPIPPWLVNGPVSKWIAPIAAQGTGNQP